MSFVVTGEVNDTYFTIDLKYVQTTFREIKHVRAYDMNSLVGNVGGYIGMFLGYAVMNFPTACVGMLRDVKKWIQKRNISAARK